MDSDECESEDEMKCIEEPTAVFRDKAFKCYLRDTIPMYPVYLNGDTGRVFERSAIVAYYNSSNANRNGDSFIYPGTDHRYEQFKLTEAKDFHQNYIKEHQKTFESLMKDYPQIKDDVSMIQQSFKDTFETIKKNPSHQFEKETSEYVNEMIDMINDYISKVIKELKNKKSANLTENKFKAMLAVKSKDFRKKRTEIYEDFKDKLEKKKVVLIENGMDPNRANWLVKAWGKYVCDPVWNIIGLIWKVVKSLGKLMWKVVKFLIKGAIPVTYVAYCGVLGGTLGSAICPGVGTAVGAVVGSILGSILGYCMCRVLF